MNRNQITEGEEYACAILAESYGRRPDATSNRLVRCVVVSKKEEVEKARRSVYGRTEKVVALSGYRVRVAGEQRFTQKRLGEDVEVVLADGEEHVFEDGRSIVAPWMPYAEARDARLAESAQKERERQGRAARYERIRDQLVALGLTEIDAMRSLDRSEPEVGDFYRRRRDNWSRAADETSERIEMTFDAVERLIGFLEGETAECDHSEGIMDENGRCPECGEFVLDQDRIRELLARQEIGDSECWNDHHDDIYYAADGTAVSPDDPRAMARQCQCCGLREEF